MLIFFNIILKKIINLKYNFKFQWKNDKAEGKGTYFH